MMPVGSLKRSGGFSLPELLLTVAILSTVLAISVPVVRDMTDAMRLGQAARELERELQRARMKAVSVNRPMRVRLNCPAVRQYRMIEVTGVPATDAATNRCDQMAFPFPGARDTNPATPEHDGPIRRFDALTTVTTLTLEFRPNGTTRTVAADGTTSPIGAPVGVLVTRKGSNRTVTINGLGKIELQQ